MVLAVRPLVVVLLVGCGASSEPPPLACGPGASAPLTPGGAVTVGADGLLLAGAAVAAGALTTVPTAPVTLSCAPDLRLAGVVPLGPAVALGPARAASDRPFRVTLPYIDHGIPRSEVRLAAQRPGGTALVPLVDPSFDGATPIAHVTVSVWDLLTYQLVETAAAAPARTWTWRAIVGASMGGGAAAAIGTRAPDKWDLVADLGGEPGPSIVYSVGMLAGYNFGGFCPGGGLCPDQQRPPYADLFEIRSDYEHFTYQAGSGVGLTLDRALYARVTRDIVRALGNPTVYNAADAYLPPGVPASWLADPDRCAHPVVLKGFHDRRFNPDGAHDVITVCDGGDSPRLGLGVFDPNLPQTVATEVLLAVDLNGNGRRDAGEPIVIQAAEPWQDVGSDGVPDEEEEGYDPITNPDPHGDDYHPLRNPTGTEKNGWRDEGEPFEDVGLDGVAGTCQQPAAGCYDLGEGDGKWTVNPNGLRWLANDAARNLAAAHVRPYVYLDAGIRDFLDSHVSTAALAGALAGLGEPVGMWTGFTALGGVTRDNAFNFSTVPWADLPPDLFVRYGDPDASADQIRAGDGRHVGTGAQILDRISSVFGWIDARWPDGDRTPAPFEDPLPGQHFTSPSTGRDVPYAVVLPPGYSSSELRYPVVFFLHGYGQQPDDLANAGVLLGLYMGSGRLQKMIVVFPDGRCRAGDGCEIGTFFADSPVHPQAQLETALYELRDEIDRRYRTR
jgi:hypothetical protein